MKILFLRPRFIAGGVYSNFKILFKELIEKGNKVFLGTTISFGVEDFKKIGVSVIELPLYPSNPYNLIKSILLVSNEIKKNNIEIVHSNHRFTSFVGKISCSITGTAFSASVHEYFINYKFISKLWSDSFIVTPSEALKKHLINLLGCNPGNIQVINNPVDSKYQIDETKLSLVKKIINYNPQLKYIGCIGRLSVEKGVRYFIESISLLKNRQNTVFVIAGEGPEEDYLKKTAEGIDADILFLGTVRENYELISLMDLIVIPSLSEGFGIVAAEAMLFSKPVIASKVGGLPEVVIHNETGYLVKPKSSFEIAESISDMLNNQEKMKVMGDKGRQVCLGRYGAESYGGCYESWFISLIRKKT